jgi:hypothetical protein
MSAIKKVPFAKHPFDTTHPQVVRQETLTGNHLYLAGTLLVRDASKKLRAVVAADLASLASKKLFFSYTTDLTGLGDTLAEVVVAGHIFERHLVLPAGVTLDAVVSGELLVIDALNKSGLHITFAEHRYFRDQEGVN